jgi:tetratricopeptide (TPR) repeat protein
VLDRLAQRNPDDVAVARERARILLEHEGDARSGFEILRSLATRSQPRPGLWADCLRASLLVDPPNSGMVELARSAAAFRSFVDPDTLFLLAAVHAHRGELDEAIEAFAEVSKHAAIMPADYLYVQARAAEHLGLREAAAAAYRQMDRSTLLGAHGHARARVLER